MAVFNRLLTASRTRGRRGWQVYAVAKLTDAEDGR